MSDALEFGAPARPGRAEAGRSGDDVRSDLHVVVEPGNTLDLVVRSRVETLYGDAIRRTVRETLESLGVTRARVTVDDRGAVPWVIACGPVPRHPSS